MGKKDGWESRLNTVIDGSIHKPFVWGQHDCTVFAARCADAVYGGSLEKKHKGKYKTLRGAAGRMKRLGGFQFALVDEGFGQLPVAFAQRGDLIVITQQDRLALGVLNNGKIVAAGVDGLVFLPMTEALEAWRK